MFNFGDIGGILNALGSLAKAGTGLYSAFSPQREPAAMRSAMDAAYAANTYVNAAAEGMGNPYYRAIYEGERGKLRSSLMEAIQELIRGNNRASARGILGAIINPERRDENTYRALQKGYQDADAIAHDRAKAMLIKFADAQQMGAHVLGRFVSPQQMTLDALNRQNRNSGFAASGDMISKLGSMFGSRGNEGGTRPGSIAAGLQSTPDDYRRLWPDYFRS